MHEGEAQIVWASPGLETFFGASFEELNRLGWRHVFFPADHASAIQRRKRLRMGERTEIELALQDTCAATRAGSTSPTSRIIALDGSVNRFIGVVHDITDRKANEEVLRSQALAIEVMHEGVVLSDSGGIIRMTNPAFDRMFGFVAGSLIGKHLSQLPCDPPLDRRIAEFADEAAARAGAPLVSELTVRGAQDGDSRAVRRSGHHLAGAARRALLADHAAGRHRAPAARARSAGGQQPRTATHRQRPARRPRPGAHRHRAAAARPGESRGARSAGAVARHRGSRAAGQRRHLHHARAGARPVARDLRSRRPGAGARGAGAAPVRDVSHRRALRGRRLAGTRTRIRERPAPVSHRAGGGDQCRATWLGRPGARSRCAPTASADCCASKTTATDSIRPCSSRRVWACASCITARR